MPTITQFTHFLHIFALKVKSLKYTYFQEIYTFCNMRGNTVELSNNKTLVLFLKCRYSKGCRYFCNRE